jgi:AraC-like DNA-binding protein
VSPRNYDHRPAASNEPPAEVPDPIASTETLAVIPACGLVVSESQQGPGRSDEREEACSKFILVLSGQARWECGGRRHMLGPDTICHLPAGLKYSQETLPSSPFLAYTIRYRPELLSTGIGSQLAALGMVPLDLGNTTSNQVRVVRSIFQEMLFEQAARQEGWEAILHSRLMDLAVRVLRLVNRRGGSEPPVFEPGSDSTDRVARYSARLRSRFFRQETIVEAARSVGLSRRQFAELFRKVTGQSWRQYVLGLRLKHAAELLAGTDRSVSAVAFECGFDDLSNFHHCFKSVHGCSPLAYREQRRVRLPASASALPELAHTSPRAPAFKFRGIKGWSWTVEQYLEEIPVLASLRMNFLMNCYLSMSPSPPGQPWCNEWWKPMPEATKSGFASVIRSCREHGIAFCFAMHPQLDSPRFLDFRRAKDLERFYQHYAWAQSQGVRWFSICLDDTSWGTAGPGALGAAHAGFVNTIFNRLQAGDSAAQAILCPAVFWGDGSNPDECAYLEAVARQLHTDVYVFWNGDAIVTPRITRVAAESYKRVVNHRLFLWDNYPLNDGSPTLHLGPVSGREANLCEIIDGYLSNPMRTQNQINRIPLATCADYAYNPQAYNPARSIGQAIFRLGKTGAQRQVLKELVEAYPGFIVAGGGTGTNPVRLKLGSLLQQAGGQSAAQGFIRHIEDIATRLAKLFPAQFLATRKTIRDDIVWMKGTGSGRMAWYS